MLLRSPTDIGAVIKDRRNQLRIGQAELARRVGVSRQWIVAVEKGHDRAELALVLSVLNALDLRLDAKPSDKVTATSLQTAIDDNSRARIALTEVLNRARGVSIPLPPKGAR